MRSRPLVSGDRERCLGDLAFPSSRSGSPSRTRRCIPGGVSASGCETTGNGGPVSSSSNLTRHTSDGCPEERKGGPCGYNRLLPKHAPQRI